MAAWEENHIQAALGQGLLRKQAGSAPHASPSPLSLSPFPPLTSPHTHMMQKSNFSLTGSQALYLHFSKICKDVGWLGIKGNFFKPQRQVQNTLRHLTKRKSRSALESQGPPESCWLQGSRLTGSQEPGSSLKQAALERSQRPGNHPAFRNLL